MAYMKPTEVQEYNLKRVEEAFSNLRMTVDLTVPSGRHKDTAETHLETAEMFFNKAIVKGNL